MPKKDLEEKEGETEARKIWTKKINKFLSDYFNWVVALMVAAIFIFGFFFLLVPKYNQTVKYVDIFSQKGEADVQAENSELAEIKSLLRAYAGVDPARLSQISAIAPVKKNKEELFSEINYLVSRSQLSLQSVSLSEISDYSDLGLVPPSPADSALISNLQEVSINLSVNGADYEVFKNFLASLENNLHLMDVVNLSFSPGSAVSLTINTYYAKE